MSLYLKYRPDNFENLMGQSFIKDTLKKAIAENKTVGAYLLCGPRGTGKTTTARLLAKTINCLNSNNGNPCLDCEICNDFSKEKLVDIIEIDAASHTGVDNIRELIERAQFLPSKTKYKIYIIDEVHMLSKGAFNALLKILEEPPKHVKFILATTETHKVPETIISRCQRYDFKRINDNAIKERLSYIAEKEGIKVDLKAYDYIINNSNGGLRNAISLFEQFIFDNKVSYENLIEKLGIAKEEELEIFFKKLLNKDSSIISDFDNLISDGKNIKLFFKELIFFIKKETLEELKKGTNISLYINILDILDKTFRETKNSLDENLTFTIGILKIINNNTSSSIPTIKKEGENTPSSVLSLQGERSKTGEKKKEICMDDVADLFSEDIEKDNKTQAINKKDFDLNNFITNLKSKGAKGALTMALRGSEVFLNDKGLEINPNTKIARINIENTTNQKLINETLEELGLGKLIIK